MVPLLRFNEYLPEAGYAGRMQMKIQAMVVHEKNGPYQLEEVELDEVLGKLPDGLREAVELRYGSGLGVGEVAQALGISRFSARRRINAALKMLEEELEEGGLDG